MDGTLLLASRRTFSKSNLLEALSAESFGYTYSIGSKIVRTDPCLLIEEGNLLSQQIFLIILRNLRTIILSPH